MYRDAGLANIHNTFVGQGIASGDWANNPSTYNTGLGSGVMQGAMDGATNNTGIGVDALNALVSGDQCTAVGKGALSANVSGSYITAIGNNALTACTASENTAVGWDAGGSIVGGASNVMIGSNAGDTLTTGNQNTCLGDSSDVSATGSTNQTAIGYATIAQADNSVTLGNASVTRVYMSQDGDAEMYANGTINTSDKRLKQDIKNTDLGLDFINNLRPVSYKLKKDKQVNKIKYGIIAQEVQEVLKKTNNQNFAGITDKGDFLGADYVQFIAPLMKAVQELSAKVAELENKLK